MTHRLAILAVEPGEEAPTLRAQAELLGYEVRLSRLGRHRDMGIFLGGLDAGEVAVLSGHGDEAGVILPEMAPGLFTDTIASNRFGPEQVCALSLAPATLISTACATGSSAMRAAFATAGIATYIAPEGDPQGAEAVLAVTLLLHRHVRGESWGAALEHVNPLFPASRFAASFRAVQ